MTIDDKLTACRAQCDQYIENSFPTIAGVNANAATIHYRYASCCLYVYSSVNPRIILYLLLFNVTHRAKEGSCSTLTGHDLLLLDSGAQYTDGTTG